MPDQSFITWLRENPRFEVAEPMPHDGGVAFYIVEGQGDGFHGDDLVRARRAGYKVANINTVTEYIELAPAGSGGFGLEGGLL